MKKFDHHSGHYVTIDDANIYYEKAGSANKTPLVLLHGGFGTISDFDSIIEAFTSEFQCIGIETRGHGKSTLGSDPLTYERLENDVKSVLEKLGITNCNLMGFSDGGVVAYRLAIHKPTLVKKLITIGADWNPPNQKLQALFSTLTADSWQKKFPHMVERYHRLNPEPDFDHLMKKVLSMWVDNSALGYPGNQVEKIACETLIIRGDNDYMMPRSIIADLQNEFANAKLLNVPFAGHAAHNDQPDVVKKIINQFIEDAG